MSRIKNAIEKRTGILFGTYAWPSGPRVLLVIGKSDRADSILEVGIAGRLIYVARESDIL